MNDLINKNNDLFGYVHPCLKENFLKLCIDGNIGLISLSINNIDILQTKLLQSRYAYNFKVQVPYAGRFLVWEVMFNPEDLEFAPDFDFNDEGFLFSSDIDEIADKVPTLVGWNVKHPDSLEMVLKEFLALYKEYQVKELRRNNIYSRIAHEYELLTSVEEICPQDVELLIENNTVQFLILIRVDISKLPEYVQEVININGDLLNPQQDSALLDICFQKLDASKVNVQLQLSPRLDQLIGNIKTFHIPHYEKDESSLVEYIPLISRMLQQEIDKIAFHHQFKKEFVNSLVALRHTSLIEYDAFKFNYIVFLCEVDNFFVMVHVKIGEEFPKFKPVVKLKSIYCANAKTKVPCEKIFDYKHFPNQPAEEMAKHLLQALKKYIPEFKLHPHPMNMGKRAALK